jgi:hypothetical protein
MSRAATWVNSDGLTVGFGTHSDDNDVAAVDSGRGKIKTMTVEITGTDLVNTPVDTTFPPQAAQIPEGSRILRAHLTATSAWTGTGTLNIGTWGRGDLTTPALDDVDGIDQTVDIDVALAAVGDTVACNGALVGGAVSVGETSNSDCIISYQWATAVPTAGTAELTVEYLEPSYDYAPDFS